MHLGEAYEFRIKRFMFSREMLEYQKVRRTRRTYGYASEYWDKCRFCGQTHLRLQHDRVSVPQRIWYLREVEASHTFPYSWLIANNPLASEQKSRSTMATVVGIGVGVAAAAFFVSNLQRHFSHKSD